MSDYISMKRKKKNIFSRGRLQIRLITQKLLESVGEDRPCFLPQHKTHWRIPCGYRVSEFHSFDPPMERNMYDDRLNKWYRFFYPSNCPPLYQHDSQGRVHLWISYMIDLAIYFIYRFKVILLRWLWQSRFTCGFEWCVAPDSLPIKAWDVVLLTSKHSDVIAGESDQRTPQAPTEVIFNGGRAPGHFTRLMSSWAGAGSCVCARWTPTDEVGKRLFDLAEERDCDVAHWPWLSKHQCPYQSCGSFKKWVALSSSYIINPTYLNSRREGTYYFLHSTLMIMKIF